MKTIGFATLSALLGATWAFSVDNGAAQTAQSVDSRRSFLGGAAAALVGAAVLAPEPASAKLGKIEKDGVVQKEMKSFNDLIYFFKDETLNGIDASKLKELSVPFIEFGERMKKGEVAFVEFIAPNGDVAYVTFKQGPDDKEPPKKIRIGQGYPTESRESWTSPAYVIRSVSNFGVPYKFTVPGLAKYSK
jgi:hypothetical protein